MGPAAHRRAQTVHRVQAGPAALALVPRLPRLAVVTVLLPFVSATRAKKVTWTVKPAGPARHAGRAAAAGQLSGDADSGARAAAVARRHEPARGGAALQALTLH